MFPDFQYWLNPTSGGALAAVLAALVAGFFASWIGADRARSAADDRAMLQMTNDELKQRLDSTNAEVASVKTELATTKVELQTANENLRTMGGELGAPTFQTPEQRQVALTKAELTARSQLIASLVRKWVVLKGDGIPVGLGVTWWPVDFINQRLETEGVLWRVKMQGDDLFYIDNDTP